MRRQHNEACTQDEFIALWKKHKGNAERIAKELGLSSSRPVFYRRKNIEVAEGIVLRASGRQENQDVIQKIKRHPRLQTEIKNGVALVGSDCHYFPGEPSAAHRAFVKFSRERRPSVVVLNGDVFDGASVSRWERIGWDSRPTVKQEIDACTERVTEIEDAAKGAEKFWPLGNHDARFETYLAKHAPQYEGVEGFCLKDWFPKWRPCWSVFINDTVVKHRFKGGIHATHNNTVWAGKSIVTGHLHSLKVTPFSDYTGTRFGVDTGTMADPDGPQFVDYTEDNPKNWRSGFAVLTYWNGKLLWPEFVHVISENQVEFRGKVYDV
jgi:hypothetical protein